MGQVIFPSGPGRVVAIQSPGVPIIIRPQGWSSDVFRSIITSIGIRDECNFQISRSLQKILYIYTFGDKEADVRIGGLTFATACVNGLTGVEGINTYYSRYKLSNYGRPLLLAIGSTIVRRVFLVGCDNSMADPASGVGQFSLNFIGLQ